jgi:glycosylphosphatidylinositol transamidase (GPIT) subunit GPI8
LLKVTNLMLSNELKKNFYIKNSIIFMKMIFILLAIFSLCICSNQQNFVATQTESNHTNNWAVIVDTSRFWFNYRHAANVLSIYRSVKRLGIPDRFANSFIFFYSDATPQNHDISNKNVLIICF